VTGPVASSREPENNAAMPFTTLIDTATLAAHLTDAHLVVADCRFDLKDTAWGERVYAEAHIPGAVYVHLGRDLSAPKTGANGRHPLPDPATAARTFWRLGIGPGTQVVAYDQDTGMYASRLWWMLRWLGHDAVAVLDGGLARWLAERRETRGGIEARTPRSFAAAPRRDMLVTADQVAAMRDAGFELVDARAPERFRGDVEPLDRVPGHIPGARNHFFQSNLGATGTFRNPAELAAAFSATLGGTPAERVICYCGSGVTACHDLLAMEHAGLPGGRLYAGSWSEWSADPQREVAKGDER
jgi:thiosulfate/3-mercaptopyruvate sulfurtransferase